MRELDAPPIPKMMATKAWKYFYVGGAFFAWGLLVYALYFV